MTSFPVTVTMLSDWRVGAGTGRHGLVDRLVVRDPAGLPYLPAKTLTGVWRDGCEIAARALDDGAADGVWHRWVGYLFGDQPALQRGPGDRARPRPAALRLTGAHFPPGVAAALADRPLLRAATTFLKPGVAVDDATGRAVGGALRVDEMARVGAVLVAEADIGDGETLDVERWRCAATLLYLGARLVEGIGGGRRRGAGRCWLDPHGLDADMAWLAAGSPIAEPPPPAPVDGWASGPRSADRPDAGAWECARLRLELTDPVVVHDRTVGNAVRGLDYLPGRSLLPAVLKMLGSDAAHRAARTGALVVTDATIEIAGAAGRPAPQVFVCDKTDPAWVCNTLVESPPPGMHPVAFATGDYVAATVSGGLAVAACPRVTLTHNTIDDTVQRPTQAVGGLYTYEAIAAGTVLRAEVRLRAGVLAPGWQDKLRGALRLGRSRKDHGRAVLSCAAADPPQPGPLGDGPLTVWLVSDMLLCDERLRPTTDPGAAAAALGAALGVTVRPAGVGAPAGAARRSESWHRGWGLPRPTLLGLAAGSCLSLEVVGGQLDPRRIAELHLAGVGLRRAEGFGQVLVGAQLLAAPLADRPAVLIDASGPPPGGAATPPPVGGAAGPPTPVDAAVDHSAAAALVRAVERGAWQAAIRDAAEALAASAAGRRRVLGAGHDSVPPSQLATVGRLLAHADITDPDTVAGWFGQLTATADREQSWPADTRAQLRRLLSDRDEVWHLLDLAETDLSTTAAAMIDLREQLWPSALRTLVADCLTAHRRARESERTA